MWLYWVLGLSSVAIILVGIKLIYIERANRKTLRGMDAALQSHREHIEGLHQRITRLEQQVVMLNKPAELEEQVIMERLSSLLH